MEKYFEQKLREAVKEMGGAAIKMYSPSFTGLPDRLVLMPGGRVYFAELKSPGKGLSPRQGAVILFLQRLGFKVFVIDSHEMLHNAIQTIRLSGVQR